MKEPHIKVIFWDLGRVLIKFDHMKACRELTEYSPLDTDEVYTAIFVDTPKINDVYNVGGITSIEFFAQVKEKLSLDDEVNYEKFVAIWSSIFEPNEDILKLLARIPIDIPQCIVSNINEIHWEALRHYDIFKTYFIDESKIILSYVAHSHKPNSKIYNDALIAIGMTETDIPQILYIDDIEEYRNAFKSRGGNAIAYDNSKDDISVLEAGLRNYGII